MKTRLEQLYRRLKARGLNPGQEEVILRELEMADEDDRRPGRDSAAGSRDLVRYDDFSFLQDFSPPNMAAYLSGHTLDDLLARDNRREEDGFPRKVQVGKMIKPGGDGDDKVVVVPTTVEEKFLHDQVSEQDEEESGDGEGEGEGEGMGGAGEGEEGEVIGEQPVREDESGTGGAGEGGGGSHEIESDAYDLGKILTEQFELPNLKDKGKKRSLSKYTYDLTDRNRGFGQLLDKKATLKRLIQTNIALGRVAPGRVVDPAELLISPDDRIYRILSREKDFESQAMVFFVRDYSGSMVGKPTELVVSQHVLIYSWLTFQYENQVETRFILHDTDADEVVDFHTYYNSKVAGGTQVSAAYKLVNEIVEDERLDKEYNIYIFHGTDGDDWDADGSESLPELKKMLTYASRIGITVAENGYGPGGKSEVEKYIRGSGLLEEHEDLLRLDVMDRDSDEPRIIEGIKALIS
ncbi:MAG: DUF444 family protein [Thermodesulfobacteriota bacterium]